MLEKETSIAKIRNQSLALNYLPIAQENWLKLNTNEASLLQIPLIDVYTTDYCNAQCEICITPKGNNTLPLLSVGAIQKLKPFVITLTGGGEPSIYQFGFENYIRRIKEVLGIIPLGVMTNGIHPLSNYVVNNLDWLRVSLNASTRDSYQVEYGRDRFETVLANIIQYVQSEIEKVGIGFVYQANNLWEITNLAQQIINQIFPQLSLSERKKINLQFRPLASKDYQRFSLNTEDKNNILKDFQKKEEDIQSFLIEQSNFQQLLDNECFQLQSVFNKCMVSLIQMNLDADGQVYPCPQKAHHKENTYGNIFDPSFFQELNFKVLQQVNTFNNQTCSHCSQGKINELLNQFITERKNVQIVTREKIKPVFF